MTDAPGLAQGASLGLAVLATAGVILRPFRLPEWPFAAAGAGLLVLLGLMPPVAALGAVLRGTDVYLFLIGMMLLAGVALREGLFDHLAARTAALARGSGPRLFSILFATGIVVTAVLSNDATAVVLTPAVVVATRHARVDPRPHLFACALIANAASFLLPISNPANLVVFGAGMPRLGAWLADLALPSLAAIAVTWLVLRLRFSATLAAAPAEPEVPALTRAGALAAGGILATAAVLLSASALGMPLGLPTLACGAAVAIAVTLATGRSPLPLLRGLSWGVLPLVAGLFVLVEAVERTGALAPLAGLLRDGATSAPRLSALLAGAGFGTVSNLMNNLPAGLVAATTLATAQSPRPVTEAVLIGIDLGPNLSVTGSLATILWLIELRREGISVTAREFLAIGAVAMPLALAAALGLLLL